VTRIYWDTMLFVYWLEEHPEYGDRIEYLMDQISRRGHTICTSVLTVGEVLTGYYKAGELAAAARVREQLRSPDVELLPFTAEAADRFARIRAMNRIAPADAIHLATAAEAGVRLFLTNDRRLSNLTIEGIDFIAGLDVNIY
jgi:uncharacterized protein